MFRVVTRGRIYMTSPINPAATPAPTAAAAASPLATTPIQTDEGIEEIQTALAQVTSSVNETNPNARLVCVSKTKPIWMLTAAYDKGARSFGENYIQELVSKVPLMPSDVEWHFIGKIQTNKAKTLAKLECPGGLIVETVDSDKLARALSNAVMAAQRPPLKVFMQVNTSGEESKSGVVPGEAAVELAKFIASEEAPGLVLTGVMTIGRPNAPETQPDFVTLIEVRRAVAQNLGMQEGDLELSMGMSADYLDALKFGATNVRVGSSIFGARSYPAKKAVATDATATEAPTNTNSPPASGDNDVTPSTTTTTTTITS